MAKNVNISVTGQAYVGPGTITGVIVTSHSSGTLKLNDSPNSAVGAVVLDTVTFAAGPNSFIFPGPIDFYQGLFATVGGTGTFELIISPA
jgi:hypothetical protein